MIEEIRCSYEVCKLLHEKGFDVKCTDWYRENNINIWKPTHQMAMKWLREVHNTSIEITSTGYLIDNDVEWECDIKAGHRLYFKHITGEKSFESVAEAAIKYCLENLV